MNERIQIDLKFAAVEKVFIGEELSPKDFERFLDYLANHPIQMAEPTKEYQEAMKAQMINILQQRFMAPPPQQ